MDTNATYLVRWRGRQQGPFTLPQLQRQLAENEIGMLHTVQVKGEWISLREFFKQIEAERKAEEVRLAAAGLGVKNYSVQLPSHQQDEPSRSFGDREPSRSFGGRDYLLNIGSCLSRGWNIVVNNLRVTMVTALLFWLLGIIPLAFLWFATNFVTPILFDKNLILGILTAVFLFGVSVVVNAFVWGPLYGGLAYTYIGLARGEPRDVGDLFAGFRRKMGQALMGYLIPDLLLSIAALVGLLPFLIVALYSGFIGALGATVLQDPMVAWERSGRTLIWLSSIYLVAYIVLLLKIYVRWLFVVPLVVDQQIGFWSAMGQSWRGVGGQSWRMVFLWSLARIIMLLGVLFCGIGLLFTGPLYWMIIMVAYTIIFGDFEKPSNLKNII